MSVSTSTLLMRVVSSSVMVVNRAGKIIRDIMTKGDLGIVQKEVNDLQTEADRSAQMCIISSLSKQFPKVAIIGEETITTDDVTDDWIITDYDTEVLTNTCPDEFTGVKDEDIVIWVDPLDGTSEYTQGLLDHVTVLIGIAIKGKAVAGVIHQPYFNYKSTNGEMGRTIWGLMGLGVFGIKRNSPPTGKRILTTTRSHLTPEVESALQAMSPTEVIRVGGAGHKVLMLIEGIAHAYVFASPGCKKWDTCAPEAVLKCVGGRLTDIHGSMLNYDKNVKYANSGGVLATHSADEHAWYVEKVPEAVRKSLKP